jgi:hypothetical protein
VVHAPTRNDAYAIDMSETEFDRLVTLAAMHDASVRDGFHRTDEDLAADLAGWFR